MLEGSVIQTRGFRNLVDVDRDIFGFQFRMSPRYYRGLWLSQFRPGDVSVDGETFSREQIVWELYGAEYTADRMLEAGDVYWLPTDPATVKVRKPGGLTQGYHEVKLRYGWVCNYISPEREDPVLGINFGGFDHQRRLLMV